MTDERGSGGDLSNRFWLRWGGGLVVASAVTVLAAWQFAPQDPFVVAGHALLGVLFLAGGVPAAANGEYDFMAGVTLVAVGFGTYAVGAATGYPGVTWWLGSAILVVGGLIVVWAEYGSRVRAVVGG